MIIISLLIAYVFFTLWKCTFFPGNSDTFYWFFFTLVYSAAFIFISVVALVRLYKKKLTFLLLTVLLLEFVCAAVFVSEIFIEMAQRFRTIIYDHMLEKQTVNSSENL